MFICGSRSSTHQEDNKANKNPYADRGLDKFSTLLADLDHVRQKIYSQMGSEDISFIRFAYSSDSKQIKPIVVKVKNKNKNFLRHPEADESFEEIPETRGMVVKQELAKRCWKFGCFLSGIIVMILVFLVIYGRFLAIIWATTAWYLIPAVIGKKRMGKVSEGPSCSESGMDGLTDGTITLHQYGHGRRS